MNYKKEEIYNQKALDSISLNIKNSLDALGEDSNREGLQNTPLRVAKAWSYMTNGYCLDAQEILKSAVFNENSQEMVIVKDIELYSMCEHHMVPFYGKAHIGYLPDGKITGLSKLARVVDVFSRRLQVQERMTTQIRDAIQDALAPHGVAVIIEAKHLCMMMRGVQKQNSSTVTSAFTGPFLDNPVTRKEFIDLVTHKMS